MNSEHVEVLRRMRNEWPLATDEGPALDAAIAALSAQQPAATLPNVDDDDLTVAYMAGRHDGRKEAQQPAAVDEALDRMRQAPPRLWLADLVGQQISVERMRDILAFALAAQPGGSDNDH